MRPSRVEFVISAASLEQVPKHGLPEIAFLGPSNVGKSSLLNSMVGSNALARVSKTPGRTQLLNFFRVDERLMFVDLPGYGFAKVPRSVQERFLRLIEAYLAGSEGLALLLLLLDCRREPSARDRELREWLVENRVPHAIALTKSDKLGRGAVAKQVTMVERALALSDTETRLVAVSAKTGAGRKELWSLIHAASRRPAD